MSVKTTEAEASYESCGYVVDGDRREDTHLTHLHFTHPSFVYEGRHSIHSYIFTYELQLRRGSLTDDDVYATTVIDHHHFPSRN